MKVWLVNFATPEYYDSQKRLNSSALQNGVDECVSYHFKDIKKTKFYRDNKFILNQKRGAGYWLWKPYIILETLKKLDPTDCLLYIDCGAEIIANINPLVQLNTQSQLPILFRVHNTKNKIYTKRDCFILLDADEEKFTDAAQVYGTVSVFNNTNTCIQFVEEWLNWCKNPDVLTDSPNKSGLPNYPEFIDHRHDQSILSILAIKWAIPIYRDPTQYGKSFIERNNMAGELNNAGVDFMNSPYPVLINNHRQRTYSFWKKLKLKIKSILNQK